MGAVNHEGVESVTYRVTYLGEEHQSESSPTPTEEQPNLFQRVVSSPNFLGGAGAITAVVLTVLLILSRREVKLLRSEDGGTEDEQEENGT